MQLVEQHCIRKSDPRYSVIDEAAFKSKNVYNAALYEMRQAFIHHGVYLSYEEMDTRMQSHEAYKALPAKVAQQVLRQLADAWKAFREAKAAYEEDPSTFTGRPKLPKYKHKTEGRNVLIYTMQAVSRGKRSLQRGIIKPSMLPIEVKTQQDPKQIDQVRIVPRNGHYVVEVIYRKRPVQAQVDPSFCVAIDLGVTNLAAITANREGFIPRLVNGRTLKAMNAASKGIIDFLVKEGVGTIIVGKNPLWKQEAGMGRRNNQNFVAIPHARFIDMLTYKAELVGIQVEIQEESYTSKASFLDLDPLPTYKPDDEEQHSFSGKRIGRRNRLYRTKDGRVICADVNGSYNILRKRKPDAFTHVDAKGIAAYVVQPLRLAITV